MHVISLLTLTSPCLGDFEMTQVICYSLVFGEIGEFGFLDLEPGLGPALCSVAVLLLHGHVWPADPVFVLGLTLQMLQRIAFHLPGNLTWAPILSDPLLPRDAFPQQGEGEKHGAELFLTSQSIQTLFAFRRQGDNITVESENLCRPATKREGCH